MNKIILKVSIITCLTFTILSCKKVNNTSEQKSSVPNSEEAVIQKSEMIIESSEHDLVLSETETLHFNTDDELMVWASNLTGNTALDEQKQIVTFKMNILVAFQNKAVELGILDNEVELQALFDKMCKNLGNEKGAGFLSSGVNGLGNVLPIPGTIAKLTGYWNNQTESTTAVATTVLCDYWWFGGKKVWILLHTQRNLSDWNFANRTSSVF